MAPPTGTLRVGRYFLALLVLLGALYVLVFYPGNRHTPKLGIDLVGGQRVIFTAISPKGAPAPTADQMTQARQILEDRINGTGVTGATVVVQGSDQLVVEIPGGTGADVEKLGQAAVLNFRGVSAPAVPISCGAAAAKATASPTASSAPSSASTKTTPASTRSSVSAKASSSAKAAPNDASDSPLAAAPTPSKKSTAAAKTTPAATTAPTATTATTPATTSAAAAPTKCSAKSISGLTFKIPTTETQYTALTAAQKAQITAGLGAFNCSSAQTELDKASSYYVACDDGKNTNGVKIAYLLGKVIVPGKNIDTASAVAPNTSGQGGSADWTVELKLNGPGTDAWSAWTGAHNTSQASTGSVLQCGSAASGAAFPCSDWVGFTLDGVVLSAPQTQSAIGSTTQITGTFDQTSANDLAKQLNYGKLPLSFKIESNQSVSATLGTSQLQAAFLAGGIGLILVVIYSLLYYRGLGLVTIASLIVSGGLTYAMLVILGEHLGFTLDLSGIAGFIVALGITADSFVVFFERIKDEVHEGRSIRVAVPRAWVRARRTVLSADTVSFLAAAILYYFASADVKGFAFTLGLSTILDLVVVFLFTHPIVSILSRSRAFGSPRFTGLNAVRVGGFDVDDRPSGKRTAATRAADRRSGGSKPERAAKSNTVVLEKDEPDDLELDEAPDAEGAIDDEPVAPDEPGDATDAVELGSSDDEPEQPRRRSTTAGATAAERAAARRARMRGKAIDPDGSNEEDRS